jgi:hypothetical protein
VSRKSNRPSSDLIAEKCHTCQARVFVSYCDSRRVLPMAWYECWTCYRKRQCRIIEESDELSALYARIMCSLKASGHIPPDHPERVP